MAEQKKEIQETEEEGENRTLKIICIIVAAVFLILGKIFEANFVLSLVFFGIAYLAVGAEVIINAVKHIFHGQIFDENLLMLIATIGATAIGEYSEAVAVMLFYQVGEFFQDLAVDRSTKSITKLMDMRPDTVTLLRSDKMVVTHPSEARLDDIMLVKPGEKIALDGVVTEGHSTVNTASLTGETQPRDIEVGDAVLSGSINIDGTPKIKVTKNYDESTASKILDMVEHASSTKATKEQFITKFAHYYTPTVVGIAALLAFVPLIFGQSLQVWGYRALIFLVVACPCALVISIPLSFFGGIGAASKNKILVKGGNHIEAATSIDTIVLDKTGTITKGNFVVTELHPSGVSMEEFKYYVANAESYSNHPIAKSICAKLKDSIDVNKVESYRDLAGKGVSLELKGHRVLVGKRSLLEEQGVAFDPVNTPYTIVYLAVDNKYAGYLVIADEIKTDSAAAIQRMHKMGIKRVIMLTGDNENIAKAVADQAGVDEYHANLLPLNKVEIVQQLKAQGCKVAVVGDGINDAPVLRMSDLGISMGGIGQDAAIEASDVVVMNDDLDKVNTLIDISRHDLKIIRENIIFAIAVKVAVMILSALGIVVSMWLATFADVGVALLAILNAIRILRYKEVK